MPAITVPGLSQAQGWGGELNLLPPGEYAFQVEATAIGQSKKGVPEMTLDLVVIGAADGDTLNGAKSKHWVYWGKSLGRLRAILDACEIPVDASDQFDPDSLVGKGFIAEVVANTYEKDDLATGGKVTKENTKIQNERPMSAGWSDATASAPPAQPAAAPAQAAPVVPAAPSRPAAPAKAAAPAARVPAPLPRPGNLRAANPGR